MDPKPTEKYRHFNHHHEITPDHERVDFGDGEFIANKQAVALLKALNEAGIRTRTHHMDDGPHRFISILLDDTIRLEIKPVNEIDATRTKYNGMQELLIMWEKK